MSKMYRPEELAVMIEQDLNDLAIELKDNLTISDEIVFEVAADGQEYNPEQTSEYLIDEYKRYTPIIIYREDRYQHPTDNYLRYNETYVLQVFGYNDELESLEKIFKEYTNRENTTNNGIKDGSFRIIKEFTDVSFGEPLDPQNGTMDMRVIGQGAFRWEFIDGIGTSYDVQYSINGINIPYIQWTYVGTNRIIPNLPINTTGYSNIRGSNYYGISFVLPYIASNPIIDEIYRDFYNKNYNKKYTLTYTDTNGLTYTEDVVLSQKSITDTMVGVLEFEVTFIRAENTMTFKINDVDTPLLSFNKSSSVDLIPSDNIHQNIRDFIPETHATIYQVEIDISDTENTVVQELYNDFMNENMNNIYKLTVMNNDFWCILKDISYSVETNPYHSLSISFVKVNDRYANATTITT